MAVVSDCGHSWSYSLAYSVSLEVHFHIQYGLIMWMKNSVDSDQLDLTVFYKRSRIMENVQTQCIY